MSKVIAWCVAYSTRALHVRIIYKGRALSARWRQAGGMISAGALDCH
jgi:hypothetical protein